MTRTYSTAPLRDLLHPRLDECAIGDSAKETFVTVRLYGRGAVKRNVSENRLPVMRVGYRLHAGDLVYSRIDARNGAFAIVPRHLEGAVVSKDFPTFEVNEGLVDRSYLVRYLSSPAFFELLRSTSFGTTNRQRLTESDLLCCAVPLPPLANQIRIAGVLDDADELRTLRARADERTAELEGSLFSATFGDPDLNSRSWSVRPAGELMQICEYGTSSKANENRVGVPILRMNNVTPTGFLDVSDVKCVDLGDAEIAKYRLLAGDVLFNRTNSRELVGKTGMWDGRFEAVAASYFIRVRFDMEQEHPQHFTTFMNLPATKRRLKAMARGAIGQANINAQELRSIPVPVPPIELQRTFAARVADIRALQAAQAVSRVRLDDLLQSTLHHAFAGTL